MITFTVDVEDPLGRYEPEGRYVAMTHEVLTLCRSLSVRGTFFVVGKIAKSVPHLITAIQRDGHEVAYHSHAHLPLTLENPARFIREVKDDKQRFEDLLAKPLLGYRAPQFSLTANTRWVLPYLAELGFLYSSSVLPSKTARFGYASAPKTPFKWQEGLTEFPVPVYRVLHYDLPYLGGFYLYVMPQVVVKRILRERAPEACLWTYTHPYDLDRESPYHILVGTSHLISILLFGARYRAEKQLRWLLSFERSVPLGERFVLLKSLDTYS